jgi:hypothetical protein
MIETIIAAVIGLIVVAAVLYFIWKKTQAAVSYYKESDKSTTTIHVNANCNLRSITVINKQRNGEVMKFVRKDLGKGEEVEFSFPRSASKQKIIVECEKGKYEYDVD